MPTQVPTASPLDEAAGKVDTWLEAHRTGYLLFCAALCFLTFTGYSHVKFPWVDEVLQMTIARLPGVRDIWAALMDGIQVDPPVLHSLQHFFIGIFGDHYFLYRLPAIAGFSLMCVASSLLVWRHAPPLYAAAAFFAPYATVLRSRAMDARPYGAMVGFAALTMLCWDNLEQPRNRMLWRIAFTLSLAATLSTHFYSILLLLPLALGELTRWILRKRADWWTVLCIAVAMIPYMVWLPILLSASKRFMKGYFYKTDFANFYDFYGFAIASLPMAGLLLILAVVAGLLGQWRVDARAWQPATNSQRALLAAVTGFLLLPLVGYAAGVLATGFFVPYYHMLAVFGVTLGLPLVMPLITGRREVIGLCLFLALVGHGLFVTTRGLSGFLRTEAPYPTLASVRKLIPEPRPDVAVASSVHFLPFYEATRSDPENNLIYLTDPEKSLKEKGTNTGDIVNAELRGGRTPARIELFDSYVATHRRVYLAIIGEAKGLNEWQFQYFLKNPDYQMRWMGKAGDFDIFRVDSMSKVASN